MAHDGLQALPITDSISARKCIAKKRFTTVSKTLFNKLLKAIHITSINPLFVRLSAVRENFRRPPCPQTQHRGVVPCSVTLH
ncbi:hypothetical protein NEIELOOT_00389 [Neisseria elongata subsp. glycolytica ATCC 29315]|uniref:Uncharacterized protein n=1 Tax=Neisseria elongata subsp. glycolytica ATCC 29315 TaxID=546263 RepID=D4DMW5_NEIEG|nr:hypothetical protein NEIELOOT_00389 [Neisseria elongata subsp. glycolytica ATCC 29315]